MSDKWETPEEWLRDIKKRIKAHRKRIEKELALLNKLKHANPKPKK